MKTRDRKWKVEGLRAQREDRSQREDRRKLNNLWVSEKKL